MKARNAEFVEKAPRHIADEVFDILFGYIERLKHNNPHKFMGQWL